LLNAGAFAAWLLASWLGLRYTLGHSLGFAAALGTMTILILMPLLFEKNKVKPASADKATPAAA
jgi:Mg/Co/Ni transporter MgtE